MATQYAVSIATRCSLKNNPKVASRLVNGDPRCGISSDLMRLKDDVKCNPKATPRGWEQCIEKRSFMMAGRKRILTTRTTPLTRKQPLHHIYMESEYYFTDSTYMWCSDGNTVGRTGKCYV
jgi:hypothetical protein